MVGVVEKAQNGILKKRDSYVRTHNAAQNMSRHGLSPENLHYQDLNVNRSLYRVSRGDVPDFGRMFLTLKYTDITQNTNIRS